MIFFALLETRLTQPILQAYQGQSERVQGSSVN